MKILNLLIFFNLCGSKASKVFYPIINWVLQEKISHNWLDNWMIWVLRAAQSLSQTLFVHCLDELPSPQSSFPRAFKFFWQSYCPCSFWCLSQSKALVWTYFTLVKAPLGIRQNPEIDASKEKRNIDLRLNIRVNQSFNSFG